MKPVDAAWRRAAIVQAVSAGMSYDDASVKYGLGTHRVGNICRLAGFPDPANKGGAFALKARTVRSADQERRMIELAERGKTYKEIGAQYGISRHLTRQIIVRRLLRDGHDPALVLKSIQLVK